MPMSQVSTTSRLPVLTACALAFLATGTVTANDDARRGGECRPAALLGDFTLADSSPGLAIYLWGGDKDLGFGGPLPDAVQLEFYDAGVGATGTFPLGEPPNNNYATCNQCIRVLADLEDGSAATQFFQSGGTMSVSTPPGDADLQVDVTGQVVEVTIDPSTFVSTPVEGGDCYQHVPETIFEHGFE